MGIIQRIIRKMKKKNQTAIKWWDIKFLIKMMNKRISKKIHKNKIKIPKKIKVNHKLLSNLFTIQKVNTKYYINLRKSSRITQRKRLY